MYQHKCTKWCISVEDRIEHFRFSLGHVLSIDSDVLSQQASAVILVVANNSHDLRHESKCGQQRKTHGYQRRDNLRANQSDILMSTRHVVDDV